MWGAKRRPACSELAEVSEAEPSEAEVNPFGPPQSKSSAL